MRLRIDPYLREVARLAADAGEQVAELLEAPGVIDADGVVHHDGCPLRSEVTAELRTQALGDGDPDVPVFTCVMCITDTAALDLYLYSLSGLAALREPRPARRDQVAGCIAGGRAHTLASRRALTLAGSGTHGPAAVMAERRYHELTRELGTVLEAFQVATRPEHLYLVTDTDYVRDIYAPDPHWVARCEFTLGLHAPHEQDGWLLGWGPRLPPSGMAWAEQLGDTGTLVDLGPTPVSTQLAAAFAAVYGNGRRCTPHDALTAARGVLR